MARERDDIDEVDDLREQLATVTRERDEAVGHMKSSLRNCDLLIKACELAVAERDALASQVEALRACVVGIHTHTEGNAGPMASRYHRLTGEALAKVGWLAPTEPTEGA
jgi:hypothetical protein